MTKEHAAPPHAERGATSTSVIPRMPRTPEDTAFITGVTQTAQRLLRRSLTSAERAQAIADAVRARLALLPSGLAPDEEDVAVFVARLVHHMNTSVRLVWVGGIDKSASLCVEVEDNGAWVAIDLNAPSPQEPGT